MMELRWLERETGKRLMNEYGYYYAETVRVLQYRQQHTVTDYSYSSDYRITTWSEWRDVPVEVDNNSQSMYDKHSYNPKQSDKA